MLSFVGIKHIGCIIYFYEGISRKKKIQENNLFRLVASNPRDCFSGACFFHRKSVQKSRINVQKSEEIKEELVKLETRNAELAAEAARLGSESGKEGEIRKRFDVVKPGEKILVIVDKNSEDVKINGEINNIGFFSKIWHWIKKLVLILSGYGLVAEWLLPKQQTGVRFSLPASKIVIIF